MDFESEGKCSSSMTYFVVQDKTFQCICVYVSQFLLPFLALLIFCAVAIMIFSRHKSNHITSLLKTLQYFLATIRIKSNPLPMTFITLHEQSPAYLSELMSFHFSPHLPFLACFMFLKPYKTRMCYLSVQNTEPQVLLWLVGFHRLDVNSNTTTSKISSLTFYRKIVTPPSSIYLLSYNNDFTL